MLFFTICRHSDPKSTVKVSRQLLRAMKLTSLLLVAACMNVSASGYGQKVTISGKDLPLEKVFSMIKRQTGYAFFYDYNIFQDTKPVTLNLKDADIEDAMRVCLWGQDLDFNITNKTISVVKKVVKNAGIEGTNPEKTVKARGVVLNETGIPLSGVTITIKETKKGTLTGAKGEFELSQVPQNATLVVSYVGYATQYVTAKDETEIQVYLSVAMNELDKAVVQAYGTTTRRLTTSDIGVLTSSEIERQPVMNPLLALQGKIAGLDVNQTSGFASAPIKVELRGRNVIGPVNTGFPSDPLYIVDGVPLMVVEIGGFSSYRSGSTGFIQSVTGGGPAGGQSPLFSINPSDIESIEVLKDADATAIYGSRGANGVILITTKKGKAGKTKLDLHLQEGVSKATRFWEMLNTPQYLSMRREAFKNDGITPSLNNGDYDLLLWDTTRYTDWQRAIYGHTGKNIDAQASIGGGDTYNTFRLGVGYNHATNILTVDGADQRASVLLSSSHRSHDQRLSITFTGNYSYTKSDMVTLPGSVTYAPNAPAIYDSAGNLNFAGWGGNTNNTNARHSFPFGGLRRPYTARTNFLNSNLVIGYQILKGLQISTSFGYNNAQADQQVLNTIASQDPLDNPKGSNQFNTNTNRNWIIEPQINYDAKISKGRLSLLVGGSSQENKTTGLVVVGNGYTSDLLIKSLASATSTQSLNLFGQYKYAALFGRATYSWEDKYIINLNVRRDGSSRFGTGNQFGNFGSVGAAWIFTEENWLKDRFRFLSFGKLKASYGTTGSDGVGDYGYLTRYSSNNRQPYGGTASLTPTQFANPYFQWQVNKKLEGSLDLGFFRDKISLSVAYYRDRCGNQLVSLPTPALSGFTSVTANSPALVQNYGWEFTMNIRIIDSRNFKWSINANTSINKNKLLAYPNFDLSPYVGTLVVGQSLNAIRALHYTGIDPLTGIYTFQDKDHDGKIFYNYTGTGSDDTYSYDLSPKFFGGLGMNFNYKDLQVSLFFNFKKQLGLNALSGPIPGQLSNQPISVLNRWQKPGDISSMPRFAVTPTGYYNYLSLSDGIYTDASFIRLTNLSISYNLPSAYVKKIGLNSVSLFFHTNNLFIITKYKGIDPETQAFGQLPPAKNLVGGLSLSL